MLGHAERSEAEHAMQACHNATPSMRARKHASHPNLLMGMGTGACLPVTESPVVSVSVNASDSTGLELRLLGGVGESTSSRLSWPVGITDLICVMSPSIGAGHTVPVI